MRARDTTAAVLGAAAIGFLAPAVLAGSDTDITWTGGGDGSSWSDPLNWDLVLVPANDLGQTFNVFLNTNQTYVFDLDDPTEITDLSTAPSGTLAINRGHSLSVLDDAFIRGGITVQNSTFSATAAGASFAGGTIDLRLQATGGGTIAIAGTGFTTNSIGNFVNADASTIDLSSVTECSIVNAGGTPEHAVIASNGGLVDLSSLSTVTNLSSDDPLVFRYRSGGMIDLTNLTETISSGGPITFDLDSISLELPNLQDAQGARFVLPVASSVSLPALLTFTNASIDLAESSSLSAPMLQDVTGSFIELGGGQTFTTGMLVEIDGAGFALSGGAAVDVAATAWRGSRTGSLFSATGSTTVLDLGSLQMLTVDNLGGTPTRTIRATAGGVVDLSGLELIEQTSTDDVLEIIADPGSLVDLSGLTQTISAGGPIRIRTSDDLTLPILGSAEQLELESLAGATISCPALTTLTGGAIAELGPGGSVNAPLLTDVRGTTIDLDGVDTLVTGPLSSIDDATILLSAGAGVNVTATDYRILSTGTRFRASGPTTVLDLSSLESITNPNFGGTPTIVATVATAGGTIDFSGVVSMTNEGSSDRIVHQVDGGGRLDLSGLVQTVLPSTGAFRFIASGAGSELDLGSFSTFESAVELRLTSGVDCRLGGLGVTGNGDVVAAADVDGRPLVTLAGAVRPTTQDESAFRVGQLRLLMTEEASFEAASADEGAMAPTVDSFELGELTVDIPAGASSGGDATVVVFVDNIDNGNRGKAREAIYVTGFDGGDGIPALNGATLVLNGLDLYVFEAGAWINLQNGLPAVGPVPFKDGFVANRLESTLGDTNGDCIVDTIDLLALLAAWGTDDQVQDLDGDGEVGTTDLLALLANWGIAC